MRFPQVFQSNSRRLTSALLLCFAAFARCPGAAADGIAFTRDIQPLLSEHCYACHGPDPGTRKAELRLDTREGLFAPTPKRSASVVPGNPDASELWKRIISTDPDEVMPPAKAHKDLKPAQKELLKRWITAGAPWQSHWAFVPPVRHPVPVVQAPVHFPIRNPIDAFVLQRLQARQLSPARPADDRRLLRRLSLDITGLPPKPEDIDAFLTRRDANRYESAVQSLMASPAWGEHRARAWLDAARYADTHGLHFDNFREMWPYRDWVIRAFNQNQPFHEFTIDQVAGDLRASPTDDQLIATGFHRCNATTNEGGTIEEENQVNYANDRVTTTAWVWLGLTANCAACHDHKFDPLSMRDFYSLAAFFRNTTQSGFDGNVKDGANASMTVIENAGDRARWGELPGVIRQAKELVDARRKEADEPFVAWAGRLTLQDIERDLQSRLSLQVPLTEGSGNRIAGLQSAQPVGFEVEGPTRWSTNGHTGSSLHFGTNSSVNLGDHGDFNLGQPFSVAAWVYVPPSYNESASLIARMDEANDHRGWDVWIQQGSFAAHLVHKWPTDALKVRTKKRVARKGEWQHLTVSFDGSGKPEGIRIHVDGIPAETERDGPGQVRGTLRTSTPLRIGRRSDGPSFVGGSLQDLRIFSRTLATPEARTLARIEDVRALLTRPVAEWKSEPRQEVLDYFLLSYAPFQNARKALAKLEDEKEGIRLRYPVTHIQREKPDSMPMASVLARGQYDRPKEKVPAATPVVLHPFPEGAPTNRLGLAQWLVARDNPLAARVTVNRFWQEVFGTGLVRTSEDFGIMGESPSHPELLDWLAVEFMESGWDVKRLFHLIVTSSTYRQSDETTPEKQEADPANRLLSRGPRFRMDAEMLRDYALAASGLLRPEIGGPSVKPYQPDGVWEAVAMPESNTREYRRDSGPALYRRSLYTFWKRSAPPAFLDLFNAPSRETCTVRRERTNTPLQALATLNDPQFIEAARILSERVLANSKGRSEAAVQSLAARILSRSLLVAELQEVRGLLETAQRFYEKNPDEAERLIRVGESKSEASVPPHQLAAFTLVANQLFNLDEALTK